LRQRGLSIRAITRETGFNRRTVTRWLREEQPAATPDVPDEAAISPAGSAPEPETPLPALWPSWDEVRRVRAAFKEARPLLLRRPEHLAREAQTQLATLLTSPIGADLQLARAFQVEWYAIWRDEHGQRRTPEEVHRRYRHWREQRRIGGWRRCAGRKRPSTRRGLPG
jgi:hypothetical protein